MYKRCGNVIYVSEHSNPITEILDEIEKNDLKHDIFFLSSDFISFLSKNANMATSVGNQLRFSWNADENYPGCNVILSSLPGGYWYLVDHIEFQKLSYSTPLANINIEANNFFVRPC